MDVTPDNSKLVDVVVFHVDNQDSWMKSVGDRLLTASSWAAAN